MDFVLLGMFKQKSFVHDLSCEMKWKVANLCQFVGNATMEQRNGTDDMKQKQQLGIMWQHGLSDGLAGTAVDYQST